MKEEIATKEHNVHKGTTARSAERNPVLLRRLCFFAAKGFHPLRFLRLLAIYRSCLLLVIFVASGLRLGAAERQTLRGHVPAAASRLAPTGRLDASARLDLSIGLPLRNKNELTSLLHDIYDPASPQFRHYL